MNGAMRPGRVVSLDLGSKRIGVACTDPTQLLASPLEVLERRGNQVADHQAIRKLVVDECEAVRVIVGLPISLNGELGKAAQLIMTEVDVLKTVLPVPVELFDERFTTTTAHASLMERNMNAQARRKVVDKVAAAVLLQTWLDAQPPRQSFTPEPTVTRTPATETPATETPATGTPAEEQS
jgi:putative holliday junction resolvase